MAVDSQGNIYIADDSQRIREVFASTGDIFTIAGNGLAGYSGDGGPATSASINLTWITGLAVDSAGNVYFTDNQNNRVRKITAATGLISTVAGTYNFGYAGDGGPATSAQLNYPLGLTLDNAGNLYLSEANNNVIREISANPPQLTHYAATPVFSVAPGTYFVAQTVALSDVTPGATIYYTLDGTTPTTSSTSYAGPITVSASESIKAIAVATGYQQSGIASGTYSITAVTSPEIVTIAGNGYFGYTGDGGIATAAELAGAEGRSRR